MNLVTAESWRNINTGDVSEELNGPKPEPAFSSSEPPSTLRSNVESKHGDLEDEDFFNHLNRILDLTNTRSSNAFSQAEASAESPSLPLAGSTLYAQVQPASVASTSQDELIEHQSHHTNNAFKALSKLAAEGTHDMPTYSELSLEKSSQSTSNQSHVHEASRARLSQDDLETFPLLDPSIPIDTTTDDERTSFDLRPPPPPSSTSSSMEFLLDRLFSIDHLKIIIRDPWNAAPFYEFLRKHRPQSTHTISRFVETQKALAAIHYANTIAQSLSLGSSAVSLKDGFAEGAREPINELAHDILPTYITQRLVSIVTEIMVKEITGQNTPVLRGLIGGLAEVYCLTDPNIPDNPIIYASEEFFSSTLYGPEYAIGRNCRFLQGPKSSGSSKKRLQDAMADGVEICETFLNYRRDGSPFINLLMVAPLYDNQGCLRYFIGTQMDVTGLVEQGRGLETFETLLAEEKNMSTSPDDKTSELSTAALKELGEVLDETDVKLIQKGAEKRQRGSRPGSLTGAYQSNSANTRKYLGMDGLPDKAPAPTGQLVAHGRLPGLFQNYLLVRPYPSLRITYTSPTLRIPGLVQSNLLEHIQGRSEMREELVKAFKAGVSVTAKIKWVSHSKKSRSSTVLASHTLNPSKTEESTRSDDTRNQITKSRWIHCTPLVGTDNNVGVWMIILVDHDHPTGILNRSERLTENSARAAPIGATTLDTRMGLSRIGLSRGLEPTFLGDRSNTSKAMPDVFDSSSNPPSHKAPQMSPAWPEARAEPLRAANLYRDYLRREGRVDSLVVEGN